MPNSFETLSELCLVSDVGVRFDRLPLRMTSTIKNQSLTVLADSYHSLAHWWRLKFCAFLWIAFLSPVQNDGPTFICCNSPWWVVFSLCFRTCQKLRRIGLLHGLCLNVRLRESILRTPSNIQNYVWCDLHFICWCKAVPVVKLWCINLYEW